MCCRSWKSVLPFALTFLMGILAVNALQKEIIRRQLKIEPAVFSENALQIISKPKASYTDAARKNKTQGSVTLRVAFLKSGDIGNIIVVNGLPDGLTEQAILAAKNIKFNPVKLSGEPITVVKLLQYNFTLY